MNKKAVWFTGGFVLSLAASIFIASTPAKSDAKIAVVNFKACIEGSKFGKKEQSRFDEMRKEMEKSLETKEKELNELAPKFKDDYLDTLTPEAEAELKQKFKALST